MKILLINNNPVVSRLTALSARKEDIEIDEVQEVTELTEYNYDIVFVDADSWNEDVKSTIFTHIETKKRVLFYAQDDNKNLELFDKGILKPFLPSEVSTVIRGVEEITTLDNISSEIEEEKSADLIKEDKKEDKVEKEDKASTTDILELESADSKTDLMDELKKIDEQKVEKETLLDSSKLENDLFKETSDELKIDANDFASKSLGSDLFDLELDDGQELMEKELLVSDNKEDKKSEDELLEFDLEKDNKLNLDTKDMTESIENVKEEKTKESSKFVEDTEKIETKVLDADEIGTIKNILEDDTDNVMELDDLVAPSMVAAGATAMTLSSSNAIASDEVLDEDSSDKKKKKKSKKEKKILIEDAETSDTLIDALSNLKVESLRELLAGATVSIKIEFPKS